MLNSVSLVGRICHDLEITKTQNNVSRLAFAIAVSENIKKADGTKQTNFVPVVAWRSMADYLYIYAKKGDLISVHGKVTTRTYDGKHGKVYATEISIDQVNVLAHPQNKKQEQYVQDDVYTEQNENEDDGFDFVNEDFPF